VILPDVNLLVYSVDETSPLHAETRRWWDGLLSSSEAVGLCYPSVLGFVRLTTSRVVFESPLAIDDAVAIATSWLAQPNVTLLVPTPRHWPILSELLRSATSGANLTTDAHLAAHAIEHGCTLYSNDRDFGRFEGLRFRNPLA
jgi:toxin-antitoxin system PIN domain toxin